MLTTVLLCTRNRPSKLKNTLAAILAQQVPPGDDFEVLVVDNGGLTDGTAQVCRDLEPAFQGRLKWIHLSIMGKSRAANAGFKSSRGEIIAFLDDDILPRKEWLSIIHHEFLSDPSLGGISGRVELFNKEDLPTGIRKQTKREIYTRAADSYDLFIGCNFAVRRAVVEKYGLYDADMGPGLRIGSGEDTDFCYRLWKAGVKLIYEPSLFVQHDHGRRSAADEKSILRCYGVARGAVYSKHTLRGDQTLIKVFYWETRSLLRGIFSRAVLLSLRQLTWLLSGYCRYSAIRLCRSLQLSRIAEFFSTGL
jgi:glycosyltransferase involved in cell wall biosynthesis